MPASWAIHYQSVGATTTILTEMLQSAGFTLSPEEASLLLLGIHEDTGSLTYDTATARDAQAAAEIARLVHYPDDADAFVTRVLERPGIDAFRDEPAVAAVLSARTTSPDLHPLDALGAILDALDARERCAAWGNAGQRLANLDALRAHAVTYVDEAMARREAPTIVGLLRQLDELVATRDWKSSPRDHQALLDGREGVSVSTWHRAKGREWPITILFGLETLREPSAFGLQVIGDEHRFDLAEPLAGRWLRYWPYPYTTANQHGPVREAVEASSAHRRVVARSQREALRLLYVGWTRARDRLVLCAQRGKLLGGLLGTLPRLDPGLFTEPTADAAGDVTMRWAGRVVPVSIWPTTESPPLELPVVPGAVTVGRPRTDFPPARLSPSAATAVSCRVGEPVVFGPRLRLTGSPDMAELGNAIHGFLAADRLDLAAEERLDLAVGLLGRHGVAPHLAASELVDAGSRLWHWVDTFAPLRVHREWPVRERRPEGSIVNGTADLVVRCDPGLVVVDHKSFPGDMEQALARVAGYSGQLATYARALGRASGSPVTSTWIHLPMLGVIVELKVDAVERVEAGAAPFTALESS